MVVVGGYKMGRGRHPILTPWGLFLPTLRECGEEGSMLMTVIALIIFLFWRVKNMAACSVLIMVIRRGWGPCNCQEGEASTCKDKEKQMVSPPFSSLPAFPPFSPTPLAFHSLFGPPPFAPPPSAPPLWEGGLFDSDALTAGLGVGWMVASAGLRDWPWVWGRSCSGEGRELRHKQRSVLLWALSYGAPIWAASHSLLWTKHLDLHRSSPLRGESRAASLSGAGQASGSGSWATSLLPLPLASQESHALPTFPEPPTVCQAGDSVENQAPGQMESWT